MTLPNGLTPKQEKIKTIAIKQLIETGTVNATAVGMQVFDTNNRNSARVMASAELQNPSIKEAIEQAMTKAGLTTDSIMENLKDLAVRPVEKVSADVKLKTNVELLKLLGAYPGTKHARLNINMKGTIKDMNHTEVKKELTVIDTELNNLLEDNPPTIEAK